MSLAHSMAGSAAQLAADSCVWQCMRVWAQLEHTASLPLSAAAALEAGTLLMPALLTPTESLDEDLNTLRQVLGTGWPCATASMSGTCSLRCVAQDNLEVTAELDGLAASVASSSGSQSVPLFAAFEAATGPSETGTAIAQATSAAERLSAARQQASLDHSRLQLDALAQVRRSAVEHA